MTDANAADWANTFYFCEANGQRVVGTCDYDPNKHWIVIRKCSKIIFNSCIVFFLLIGSDSKKNTSLIKNGQIRLTSGQDKKPLGKKLSKNDATVNPKDGKTERNVNGISKKHLTGKSVMKKLAIANTRKHKRRLPHCEIRLS